MNDRVRMLNAPNLITLLRLATVPVLAWLLLRESYVAAVLVFMVAAASDTLDGWIARRYDLVSRFGATLDPIADKLSMFVATVMLAWQGLLPLWLAIAIVVRDLIIVGGVIAYRMIIGPIEMAPTQLSKFNTTLEFGLLLVVMAIAAGWFAERPWRYALFVATAITVVLSGAQYVWIAGRQAMADRERRLNA